MNLKPANATLPTKFGVFRIIVWPGEQGKETIVFVTPHLDLKKPVTVRVHSECITGDNLGSLKCDCGRQKEKALEIISRSANGIFIYLRQEGRGIGLYEKIRAYALQEQGYDTHEANIILGHEPDPREYSAAKEILDTLGIKKIDLITNNPSKINALREYGFTINSTIPVKIRSNIYNKRYLETKRIKFKHFDLKFNSNYYLGVCRVNRVEEIEKIAEYVKHFSSDPFVRIGIGISTDSSLISDTTVQEKIKKLLQTTNTHVPPLVPIVHYSFKNSTDYMKDLQNLVKKHPYIKRILLNDLEKDHIKVLHFAVKHFKVHFPINDKHSFLLSNQAFIKIVRSNKVFIVLDNSGGRGIKEKKQNYKERINLCLENGINDIGLAGGFGPDQLQTYLNLKNYYKINFSIDAESNLHTNEKLNMSQVKKYLDQLLNPK
jgi:GTP cyclohydrolase II